jgi:excisionase family DNA binding protein
MAKATKKASSLMTVDEVAQYLKMHPLTIRRLAREKKIPAFKLGRQWRVKRELLDEWLEKRSMQNVGSSDQA